MYSFSGVSFVNSLPFFRADSDLFDMRFEIPSRLNGLAAAGASDVSMISRWRYPDCSREYAVLPRFCVGGDGEIMSIKLFSNLDISRLDGGSIFITPQTGTSSRAFRKICLDRFGFDLFEIPRAPLESADSALLIGDDAMLFDSSRFSNSYDLGELWRDWAKCKMIYAVFVVRRSLYAELAPKVVEYLDRSLALFAEDPDPTYRRAAEISRGRLSVETLQRYYGRLIFKMSEADFEESFNFVEKNGVV